MRPIRPLMLTLVLATGAATALPAAAQEYRNELKARQGQMRILAINLGVLGAMAKGEMPYDADAATAAANNIVAVTEIDQRFFWPEGSDSMSLDGTRAEPMIWDDFDAFVVKFNDLGEKAPLLQAAAAEGPDAIGPALGQVGGACQSCHDDFQTPN